MPEDLPDDAVVSRRFGINQSSGDGMKVRLIDDFSGSGVNDTVQVESAVKLHTLDVAAALCMELLKSDCDQQWVGKTLDLSAAYRQLGVAPGSRWVSYIAVYDPGECRPKIFAMRALPFGASKSVYSFLRVSHSLWWLGCKSLKLVWSNFFDDYITFCRAVESDSVAIAALQFFRLLGWAVSSGDKDLPFSERFKALGVEIDCSKWTSGCVSFANTEKRVKELTETIDEVLLAKRLTKQGALVLRGRMQFAKAQLWGRAARLCLSAVTAHACNGSGDGLGDHTLALLKVFRCHLLQGLVKLLHGGMSRISCSRMLHFHRMTQTGQVALEVCLLIRLVARFRPFLLNFVRKTLLHWATPARAPSYSRLNSLRS